MKILVFFFLSAILVSADQWAVILAGSHTWFNYRHQADACHAYQVHKAHGIPKDHIILLAYDDIANHSANPFPGHIYNQPGDNPPDVYDGCEISYRENEVTPAVYRAVLTGDVDAVKNLTGRTNPPVLKSNENDTVFLTFFDHGGPYIICFPDGSELSNDLLVTTLHKMYYKKMYKKLVYYMEACYSGSMFDGADGLNIYAVTAATRDESSWAAYCDKTDTVRGENYHTCLGDLFSIVWMEDTDLNKRDETLSDQWNIITKGVTRSSPQQIGELSWLNESIWDFIGNGNNSNRKSLRGEIRNPRIKSPKSEISSRDVYMYTLKSMIQSSNNEKYKSELISTLKEEENYRRVTDNRFNLLVNKVTGGNEKMKSKILNSGPSYSANKECYYELIEARKNYCGKTREYTLKYYPVLMNLCDFSDGKSSSIIDSMKEVCRSLPY